MWRAAPRKEEAMKFMGSKARDFKSLTPVSKNGSLARLVPVVTLPPGTSIDAPAVKSGLAEIVSRITRAVPAVRVASYASSGDRAFVSGDGRTIFMVAYPPPESGHFGQSPNAVKAA